VPKVQWRIATGHARMARVFGRDVSIPEEFNDDDH
jgi:hypothetical protein